MSDSPAGGVATICKVAELPATLLTDQVPVRYVVGEPDPDLDKLQHPDWDAILPKEQPDTRYLVPRLYWHLGRDVDLSLLVLHEWLTDTDWKA